MDPGRFSVEIGSHAPIQRAIPPVEVLPLVGRKKTLTRRLAEGRRTPVYDVAFIYAPACLPYVGFKDVVQTLCSLFVHAFSFRINHVHNAVVTKSERPSV